MDELINNNKEPENDLINTSNLSHLSYTIGRKRDNSISSNPAHNQDLNKFIIPYDIRHMKYMIAESNVNFYMNKQYIMRKLEEFNNLNAFQLEKQFKATKLQNLSMFILMFIIGIIVVYISVITLAFFSFNPVLIYTFGVWGKKFVQYLFSLRAIFIEKSRMNCIQRTLEEENSSGVCNRLKLEWIAGQSGTWLELKKNAS